MGVRTQARAQRRRTVSLTVAAVVVVVLVAATAIGLGRPTAAPLPPVGPLPSDGSTEADFGGVPPCAHTPEKEPPNQPVESDLQAWVDDLPTGAPPSTPYWNDGVLHVEGAEIDAPYDDVELDAAGRTVLVGGYENAGKNSGPTEWSYLGDDGLEPLPVPARQWPSLSADGRIAYWSTYPEPGTTQFFTWDTETNTELASRTLQGDDDMCARRDLLGIDAAGIGYWLDGSSDPSRAPDSEVVRWDVRADTIEATDLTYDPSLTLGQFDVFVGLEDAYTSPDGTRELFTGPAPGDPSPDCCTNTLRVRPAGPLDSVAPDDIVDLGASHGDSVHAPLERVVRPGHLGRVVGVRRERSPGCDRGRPQLPRPLLGDRRGVRAGLRPRSQQEPESVLPTRVGAGLGLRPLSPDVVT